MNYPHSDCSQDSSYAKSIVLPCDQIFRNLKTARSFAIDIGGSLAKLAYCSTVPKRTPLLLLANNDDTHDDASCSAYHISEAEVEGMRLHFIKFETKYIEECLDFIRDQLESTVNNASSPAKVVRTIKVTGGGAYKYYDLIEEKLGFKVDRTDEMECLIKGCNFLLQNISDECFTYQHHESQKYKFPLTDPCCVCPYLLVNIGSGVSIVKVDGPDNFERVGGTSIGGGTFWGLGSLLTDAKGFDELLKLAEEGDHRNVDMLVSDIYGGAYQKLGLPPDLIASSFGKAVRSTRDDCSSNAKFKQSDIARSLLLSISNSIGQLAYLYAKLHGIKRIYFGGFFIRGHIVTMRTMSFAVNFWSKGECQALFLRHEGYLGSVGAFLKGAEEASKIARMAGGDSTSSSAYLTAIYSWSERYAGSSGLLNPVPAAFLSRNQSSSALIHLLEMDCAEKNLVCCPLLADAATYVADTVDLIQDPEARDYWLNCFEAGIEKTVKKAIASQPNSADAEERANNVQFSYIQHLRLLKHRPYAYGCLNVRSLLDLNEQLLNEYYFPDAYLQQKQIDNDHALRHLAERLQYLETLSGEARELELAVGLLAGNVFDWGAKEVVSLLENSDHFSFGDAREKLQPRPWLFDNFDQWLARLKETTGPHRAVCMFIDNSGVDVVLGILPFALQFLRRGTRVILCANSRPALNDVTLRELQLICKKAGKIWPELQEAIDHNCLLLMENGQGSPCLDLSRIDGTLVELMEHLEVDLVVLEGMGRAIHTNFAAAFSCEVLKIAVIKNQWLANRLGGDMFSVVFKYERPKQASKRATFEF